MATRPGVGCEIDKASLLSQTNDGETSHNDAKVKPNVKIAAIPAVLFTNDSFTDAIEAKLRAQRRGGRCVEEL